MKFGPSLIHKLIECHLMSEQDNKGKYGIRRVLNWWILQVSIRCWSLRLFPRSFIERFGCLPVKANTWFYITHSFHSLIVVWSMRLSMLEEYKQLFIRLELSIDIFSYFNWSFNWFILLNNWTNYNI